MRIVELWLYSLIEENELREHVYAVGISRKSIFFSQEICFLFFPFVLHSLDFGERTSLSLSSLSQGVKTSSLFLYLICYTKGISFPLLCSLFVPFLVG